MARSCLGLSRHFINYERHSPLWIETLLARSGSALIDICGGSAFEPVILEHPRSKPVLQSIFQRIASLRMVNLHIRRVPWEPICRSFLGHPASNLEFLNLVTSHSFPDCLYPNPLFADEAPCLRRLHLEKCLIDFSSSVLSNLTVLSVRNVLPRVFMSASAYHRLRLVPSVAGWLRVLKNIPALRFLTLISAISHFMDYDPLPVVDLPRLSLLTISTTFNSGISLIDHLNIPPSCGIRFRLYPNYSKSRATGVLDSHKLFLFLSKQLTLWPRDCFDRYLQAKILDGDRIHFGNYKRVGEVEDLHLTGLYEVEAHSQYSKDPILSLHLAFDALEDSFTFFNQLLELYSPTFSTTTTLDLWVAQEYASSVVLGGSFSAFATFHSFINVKTLNLLGKSPLYLLPLFQHSSLPGHPLFPALQSLHLTGTIMDDGQGAMCSVFIAFLFWRAEAAISLSEIKMLGGFISNQTAEDLSRLGNLRVSLK